MNKNVLIIASDHAGYQLKKWLIENLKSVEWKDYGAFDTARSDYPDYAHTVAKYINNHCTEKAILICGSGQGMCMTANKYPLVRAALAHDEDSARLSREHNNANILCLGARFLSPPQAQKIIETFLATSFSGGRHQIRIDKIIRRGP
jgi:ribose 5-phosphate isomerase B